MLWTKHNRINFFQLQKIIGSYSFVFYLLFLSSFSFAQIKTEIDTAHIKIGEPIHYTLSIPLNSNQNIQLPKLKDTLTFHIEILDQKIDTVLNKERKFLVQHLTLTSYDPGQFLIRSLPVIVNTDTLLSHSFHIQVDDVEIDSTNLAGFPIKPIMNEQYTLKDYWDIYWVYLVVIVLILLIFLTILILFLLNRKKKKRNLYMVKTPYEEAVDALNNLDKNNYLNNGKINIYYSELSFLLRRYLGRVYHFSSLELLSDDLIEQLHKTTHLNSDEIDELKQFLYDSDLVKFAKATPSESQHKLYRKWAEEFIEKVKPLNLEDESAPELKPNEKYRKV